MSAIGDDSASEIADFDHFTAKTLISFDRSLLLWFHVYCRQDNVTYQLASSANGATDYFYVGWNTGVISLKKSLSGTTVQSFNVSFPCGSICQVRSSFVISPSECLTMLSGDEITKFYLIKICLKPLNLFIQNVYKH